MHHINGTSEFWSAVLAPKVVVMASQLEYMMLVRQSEGVALGDAWLAPNFRDAARCFSYPLCISYGLV